MLTRDGYFPDDLDTTSLALQVLRPNPNVITSVLDEMLEYVNSDGTIQVSHANASDTFNLCKTHTDRQVNTLLKYMRTRRHILTATSLEPTP